jgi:hypothetical protein
MDNYTEFCERFKNLTAGQSIDLWLKKRLCDLEGTPYERLDRLRELEFDESSYEEPEYRHFCERFKTLGADETIDMYLFLSDLPLDGSPMERLLRLLTFDAKQLHKDWPAFVQ